MKRIILLLILITGAFVTGRFFDTIKKRFKRVKFKPNAGLIVAVAAVCLFLGIFIGKGANVVRNIIAGMGEMGSSSAGPIVKNARTFVLCGFESDADLQKWTAVAADIKLSDEYVTSGSHCGKFTYAGGTTLSKIAIEKYFYKDKRLGNWEGYSYLLFDIYSTQVNSERVSLKMRDENEKTFQRDIFVPSKRKHTVKIFVSEIQANLDVRRIRQFNLFRWEQKQEAVFYIDNIRLANDSETAAQPSARASEQITQAKSNVNPEGDISLSPKPYALSPNRGASSEQRKLTYLLAPDLEKWRVMKGSPVPTSIIRFPAYISDPLKLSRNTFPASGGIPFAEGELASIDDVNITDKDGAAIPFQAKPTAYWPDGSIKWLLVDLQADVDQTGEKEIFVEYGQGAEKERLLA